MSDTHNGPEATENDEGDLLQVTTTGDESPPAEDDSELESYPAEVVRKLREENAKTRTRAKDAEQRVDALSRELFSLKVAALDRLADASDLEYSADLLADPAALTAAVEELITKRPHYAKRRVSASDVGQGRKSGHAAPQDFSSLLRG